MARWTCARFTVPGDDRRHRAGTATVFTWRCTVTTTGNTVYSTRLDWYSATATVVHRWTTTTVTWPFLASSCCNTAFTTTTTSTRWCSRSNSTWTVGTIWCSATTATYPSYRNTTQVYEWLLSDHLKFTCSLPKLHINQHCVLNMLISIR